MIVKAAFAVVLHDADDDSVTETFPVIGAAPIVVVIDAVAEPAVTVIPVGTVHEYVFPDTDVVLNDAPVVPSHNVVVPVMLGVGLIGLLIATVFDTAAHGAFVTDHVNV